MIHQIHCQSLRSFFRHFRLPVIKRRQLPERRVQPGQEGQRQGHQRGKQKQG